MSPNNSPPRNSQNEETDVTDNPEYLLEDEALEIIEIPSDLELSSDGEEMQDLAPTTDNSKLVLKKHKESVFCLDIHPSGRLLVTGSQEHMAIVWDLAAAKDIFTCTGHEDSVTCVAFSPGDGAYLATGDMAGGLRIWRLELSNPHSPTPDSIDVSLHHSLSLGDLIWLFWWRPPANPTAVKSTSPLVLFTGSEDGVVSASLITGNKVNERPPKYLVGSGSASVGAAIVPSTHSTERPFLAVVGRDGDFRVWDIKTEKMLLQTVLTVPTSSSSRRRRGDNDNDNEDEAVEESDESTSGFLCLAAPKSNLDIVALASYELILLVPCRPPPLEELDDEPKKIPASAVTSVPLEGAGTVEAMEFCSTHPYLAFGTVAGQIGVYDAGCMRMRQLWSYSDPITGTEEAFGITALKWSRADPLTFFTATLAATVVAWSAGGGGSGGGAPLAVFRGHAEAVLDIALSPPVGEPPREEFLASVSDDATVRIYDLVASSNSSSTIQR